MNRVTCNNYSVVIPKILFGLIVLLGGCAHQETPSTTNATPPPPEKAEITLLNPKQDKMVLDNGVPYKIVSTPFGMTKQPIIADPPDGSNPFNFSETPAPEPAPKTMPTSPHPPLSPVSKKERRYTSQSEVPEASTGEGQVTLNFDDADLYEVVRFIAEILNINYMVDPNVRGKVTIHTAGTLERKDLFPLFFQILEANGLTAVKEGPVYKITSLKDAPRFPLTTRYGKDYSQLPPSERLIMQIIPLKHIDGAEMIKILSPFVSAEGTLVFHEQSNTLIMVDKGLNVLKSLHLVESFDVDLFAGVTHRFFKIENNEAAEFAQLLKEVLSAYQGRIFDDVKIIPLKRLNMLLVVSAEPQVFDKVAHFIETLDTPNDTIQPKLHVYAVKNGKADDLAGLLKTIFTGNGSGEDTPKTDKIDEKKEGDQDPQRGNPFAIKAAPKAGSGKTKGEGDTGADLATGTLRGELKITADTTRNTLIIEAIPSDYLIIQKILGRLDVLPRQVLIEAMIVEVTLDDSTRFGVEWKYVQGDGGSISTALLSASMGAAGMAYVIGETDRWSATITALASDNKVNILSSPTVLASNDNPATINISTEVPVASAQYQFNDASAQPVVTTNIEYRNTGIILDVTPHINENGMVSMEISQEVSEVAGEVLVGGQLYPSFFNRSVTTTLTVGHRQTVVIGGLIRENKASGQSGVPFISKLPIIGPLFGTNSRSNSKAELIILITPRVIVNLNDVEVVTEEFKNRVPNALRPYIPPRGDLVSDGARESRRRNRHQLSP